MSSPQGADPFGGSPDVDEYDPERVLADDEPASLAELESGLRALTERLDEVEYGHADAFESLGAELTEVRETVDELVKVVDQLVAKEQEDPPPPMRWAARATADDWARLVAWVDGVRLSLSLTDKAGRIQPCWPAHPGVVEELAALRAAWIRAVIAVAKSTKTGTADYIAFYDRWFWPCLARLDGAGYRITNCRGGHRPEPAPAVAPTDKSLVPPPGKRP